VCKSEPGAERIAQNAGEPAKVAIACSRVTCLNNGTSKKLANLAIFLPRVRKTSNTVFF
jgi:hypothetical protein